MLLSKQRWWIAVSGNNSAAQVAYESVQMQRFVTQTEVPDVTVFAAASDNQIDYWILEKNALPQDGGRTITTSLPDTETFWKSLNVVVRKAVLATGLSENEVQSIWLNIQGLGKDIYDRFLSEEIKSRAQCWPDGTVVAVASNDKWIPWELLYDGQDFWGSKFILTRIPKVPDRKVFSKLDQPIPTFNTSSSSRVVNVVGGQLGANYTEQVRKLFGFMSQLNGALVEIKECCNLYEVLTAMENADLVHFTCHGSIDPFPNLQLAHEAMSPVSCMNALNIQHLHNIHQSLIFTNACTSAGTGSMIGELRNFGWEFYKRGAGAYIGTLGLIPTRPAISFAEMFYRELFSGKNVGYALRNAKINADRNNPFWLLYCLFGNPFLQKDNLQAVASGQSLNKHSSIML